MKKSWIPNLLVVTLLALLVLTAALQYVWLEQISDAARERLHRRLESNTKNFAEDFNKEIRNAYFFYRTDASDLQKKIKYKLWQSQTKYPHLIKDYYFVGKNALPVLYDTDARGFKSVEWTDELREVAQKISDKERTTSAEPIQLNEYTILLPDFAADRESAKSEDKIPMVITDLSGYVAIKFDENTVKQMLADLNQKYFSDQESGQYNIAVLNKSDSKIIYTNSAIVPGNVDASIALFDLSVNNVVLVGNNKVFSSFNTAVTLITPANSQPTPETEKNDDIKNQTTNNQNAKLPEVEAAKGLWILKIQHVDGSLENFVSKTCNKNLAISFGILSLLGASVGLIFVSAQRAKILARRQIDFVSAVSHEFRTPLAVIYSAGENLADGVTKEEKQVARYGDLIKREGGKLSQMVEQILEFAGARSGGKKYNFSRADVSQIIENALAQCQLLIDEKQIFVEKEIAGNLPKISADENALSRAVQNLIVNAVKYGGGERWLKISAQNGGGQIEISIEDRGIGIAKKDLTKIFAPFFRAKEVSDAQIHGNGLGLSLVKQIVDAHGGKITVESEIRRGSKFTIKFPRKEDLPRDTENTEK